MQTSIVKKYTFEAAHRLGLGYIGKCANLHGHSYNVFIEIAANNLDEFDMVVDFGGLKPIKVWIDENLDHKTVLQKKDNLISLLRFESGHDSVFTMVQNPTAEAIARVLFKVTEDVLDELFLAPDEIAPQVVSVTVQETETGSATFRGCQ